MTAVPQQIGYVGKPFGEMIRWLVEQGYEVIHFVDRSDTFSHELFSGQVRVNLQDKTQLFSDLRETSYRPAFFLHVYENAVLPVAWLNEYYQLPGLSEAAARASTDKSFMRSLFRQYCPQFTPRFSEVQTWEDIERFLRQPGIAFPLMLKPTNLFKSLLVTKNTSFSELKENFSVSLAQIQQIYAKESVRFPPRFVIEEYLDGPSFSLEVFTDTQGRAVAAPSVVDLVMSRDRGKDDNSNFSRKLPSAFSAQVQQALEAAALAGVQALGITGCPAHVEMVYTKSGAKIIEIGARNGGYRSRMHRLAHGIELTSAHVAVAQGKLPSLTASKNDSCAVYEFFPDQVGTFVALENQEAVQALPSLHYFSLKAQPGQRVGPAKDGYRAGAVLILASSDSKQFATDCQFVESQVSIQTA